MDRGTLSRLLQPRLIIGAVAVVSVVSVAVVVFVIHQSPSNTYILPTQGSITQEVDTPGTIQSAEAIDLSFNTSGNIASVPISVGQNVSAGQTLATLDGASLSAQVEQAKATLAMQQANLQGLQAGATPTDIAAAQTAVTNAQNGLLQADQGLVQASQNAYVQADAAIENTVDQFVDNGDTSAPTLVFNISNSQVQQEIISGRVSMEALLAQWQTYEQSLPTDPSSVDTATLGKNTASYLSQVADYLNDVSVGLNEAIPNTTYSASTIQTYQGSIAAARTTISGDTTALNAALTALTSAQSALASAQAQLNVTTAGATPSDIAAQQAEVQSAQASVDAAQANINNTVLSAPIAGIITVNNAHIGATASPGVPVISMDSAGQFQIVAYVSETDMAKINVGDTAQVSLDAYPNAQPLSAHVIQIDPAATAQNGVNAYKITLQFDTNDASEKAGLTGNVKILTATQSDALSVPTSAIITQGNLQYVMEQEGSGEQLMPVTTGITSASGYTQILSGISPTDHIRAFGNQ